MAYEPDLKDRVITVYSAEAVTAGRFGVFSWTNSRREVAVVSAAGARPDCVILEAAAAGGERVQVAIPGQELNVEAGAAIATAYADCMSDANGRLVDHSTTVGHFVVGQAQAPAAAAGDHVGLSFGTPYPHGVA